MDETYHDYEIKWRRNIDGQIRRDVNKMVDEILVRHMINEVRCGDNSSPQKF